MFGLKSTHVKLFGVVVLAILVYGLMFIAPQQYQFYWDYLNTTPPWIVIGDNIIVIMAAVLVTAVLMVLRRLVF